MEKVGYKRSSTDEVVFFQGETYCVKTPWQLDKGGNVFLAKAIKEGAKPIDGKFPIIELEAFWLEDGTWDVISIWDLDQGDWEDNDSEFLSWACGIAA